MKGAALWLAAAAFAAAADARAQDATMRLETLTERIAKLHAQVGQYLTWRTLPVLQDDTIVVDYGEPRG